MNKVCVRNVVIGEGMPKICAPVVGRTREEILLQVKELLEAGPDLAAVSYTHLTLPTICRV